jgi:HEAT repeat protein
MNQPDIATWSVAEKLRFLDTIVQTEACWSHEEELVALLQDSDPSVRVRAAVCFWELANPAHLDLLLELALNDPDTSVRTAVITALGRYVYEGFVLEDIDEIDFNRVKSALLEIYRNPASPLAHQCAALEGLGFITDDEIEALIREAYAQPEKLQKISALFAMGRSGTRAWDSILAEELRNPDSEIRFEAVRAAGETYLQAGAETLEKLTADPDRDMQLAAIEALGKAGRAQSRAVLERLCSSPDEDVRDAATAALEDLEMFESDVTADTDGGDEPAWK